MTTLNQTMASYWFGIIAAEYIVRIVPPGTHSWSKFIRPSDLITLFEKSKKYSSFTIIVLNIN